MTVSATGEVEKALRSGDVLLAYDIGQRAIADGEDDLRLRYFTVVAVARSAAPERAMEEYRHHRLHDADDLDCRALWARLLKDVAFSSSGTNRRDKLGQAADAYLTLYHATGDFFPGINAASLMLLGGHPAQATSLASAILHDILLLRQATYYAAATAAEAELILGNWDACIHSLHQARARLNGDFGALSTTFKQISRLVAYMKPPELAAKAIFAAFQSPRVAYFSGTWLDDDSSGTHHAAEKIACLLETEAVGFGVGTLSTSGDLLIAEQLLARKAELHIVLPYLAADYLAWQEKRAQADILPRCKALLAQATSVTLATTDHDISDASQHAYGRIVAMGLARLRASHLMTEAVNLVVGPGTSANAGDTGFEIRAVRSLKIDVPGSPASKSGTLGPMPPRSELGREIRAILFADFHNFTSLPEGELPDFWSTIMAGIASVLGQFPGAVLHKNTWGDALFLVLENVSVAAEISLRLQEFLATYTIRPANSPVRSKPLALRISLHQGPVYRGVDPVKGEPTYFGTQINRAARAEPIAPPGGIVATEPFAAMLALADADGYSCNYVGLVPFAKGYGEQRTYSLTRQIS